MSDLDPEDLARRAGVETSAFIREWEGDESDLNHWMVEVDKDNLDKPIDRWVPVYTAEAVAAMFAQHRKEVLEEAAKMCVLGDWTHDWHDGESMVEALGRALRRLAEKT